MTFFARPHRHIPDLPTWFLAVVLACVTTAVTAADLQFLVVNEANEPVADAVIFIPAPLTRVPDDIAVMDQIDQAFAPTVLVIQQGQKVRFPNSDYIRHHVYSFSPVKPFEIKLYAGVPEAPLLFDKAGVAVLGCNIHDNMLGYIVIADTPYAQKTNAEGLVTFHLPDTVPTTGINVWHPLSGTVNQAPLTFPLPVADADGRYRLVLSLAPPKPKRVGNTFGERFKLNGR